MKLLALICSIAIVSCSGVQRPAPSWDVASLAAIHGTAHALVAIDDGAAAFYRARTDAIAASDGGLRGSAYIAATAQLDTSFQTLVHDLGDTREALLLAEALVRQAQAIANTPSKCRAVVGLGVVTQDLALLAEHSSVIGLHVDPSLALFAHQLSSIVSVDGAACVAAQDGGADEVNHE